MSYTEEPEAFGDIFTLEEFRDAVRQGYLIDYDGYGYPMKDDLVDDFQKIFPSDMISIPKDATHIIWFNR
jgi:hypothetical protein